MMMGGLMKRRSRDTMRVPNPRTNVMPPRGAFRRCRIRLGGNAFHEVPVRNDAQHAVIDNRQARVGASGLLRRRLGGRTGGGLGGCGARYLRPAGAAAWIRRVGNQYLEDSD